MNGYEFLLFLHVLCFKLATGGTVWAAAVNLTAAAVPSRPSRRPA